MTPKEMADEQMAQLLKDYPTFEDLENSIRNGEWEEIEGAYLDAKTGKVSIQQGNKWNPPLEEYGVLYITTDSSTNYEYGCPSAISQYFDFGDVTKIAGGHYSGSGSGREADHRHINISSDNYKERLTNHPHTGRLNYDYEELQNGSWAITQRFFLYAPQKPWKWLTINWKNSPFEVKS